MDDRRGIGEAGRLDSDAAERRQQAFGASSPKIIDGVRYIAADRATDAAILEQYGVLDRRLEQQMIDANRPQFIDDDDRVRHRRVPEKLVEHGCLSTAKEARDYRHGN